MFSKISTCVNIFKNFSFVNFWLRNFMISKISICVIFKGVFICKFSIPEYYYSKNFNLREKMYSEFYELSFSEFSTSVNICKRVFICKFSKISTCANTFKDAFICKFSIPKLYDLIFCSRPTSIIYQHKN